MTEPEPAKSQRLSAAGWIALASMLFFLVLSVWFAIWAWGQMEGVTISTAGWVFMGLGVFFSIAVGGGLMALVFYSARKNYDR